MRSCGTIISCWDGIPPSAGNNQQSKRSRKRLSTSSGIFFIISLFLRNLYAMFFCVLSDIGCICHLLDFTVSYRHQCRRLHNAIRRLHNAIFFHQIFIAFSIDHFIGDPRLFQSPLCHRAVWTGLCGKQQVALFAVRRFAGCFSFCLFTRYKGFSMEFGMNNVINFTIFKFLGLSI